MPPTSSVADPTAIIAARCGTCHSTAEALDYRATGTAQAQKMLQKMIRLGTNLTTSEEQALVKYFTR